MLLVSKSVVLSDAACFVSYKCNYRAFVNIRESVTKAGYSLRKEADMILRMVVLMIMVTMPRGSAGKLPRLKAAEPSDLCCRLADWNISAGSADRGRPESLRRRMS